MERHSCDVHLECDARDKYSNRAEHFKQPKNHEDSSDLDENLTESIAAMKTIISKIIRETSRKLREHFRKNFKRPKNREDSSDLDENLTESIAAMKTIIFKKFVGPFLPKNLAKTSRNHRRRGRWHARNVENPPSSV